MHEPAIDVFWEIMLFYSSPAPRIGIRGELLRLIRDGRIAEAYLLALRHDRDNPPPEPPPPPPPREEWVHPDFRIPEGGLPVPTQDELPGPGNWRRDE